MSDQEFRDTVTRALTRLIEISGALREAMLSRDPRRIQEIVEQQDQLCEAVPAWPTSVIDEEVQALANQLHRIQESNRLLASAFLRLYRDTLTQVAADSGGRDPGGYNPAGHRVPGGSPPLLISQTG